MRIRSIIVPSVPPPSPNPSDQTIARHHFHHDHDQDYHHHGIHAMDSIIIIVVVVISIVLLLTALLLIVTFRRIKSARSNADSSSNKNTTNVPMRKLSKFGVLSTASAAGAINASPDVRNCLYMGNVGRSTFSKNRGQVFTYKELEQATDAFSEGNVIGNGGFGVVYRGTLSDGTLAAIKMLNREGKQGEREFRVEVDLLSRLHSPYLVELLGYCADQHHRLLVFEFMPNGNLQHHLHPSTSPKKYQPLDWAARLRIALDCARGLEFLHEQTVPTVIHRDFKCSNILLDENYRAKVSDFGLAKTGSDKINGQILTRVLGTTGYVAPEYAQTGKLTTKSDVYSYGVVLLELLTGRVPVDNKRPPGEHILVSWALPRLTNREKVMGMVDPLLEGQYLKKELIQIAAIAAMCVQSEAHYRPLMTDVVQSLIPLVKRLSMSGPTTTSTRLQHQT
ncbi:probable serine/threonine-protein kinase PBL7 [Magnolia sinica]|uniref:probable serine/threonine-protein kinase PBL7 n=1 Tax=Magnolia sinica TaxID=86752 RepID=UPI0026590C86|nr:probable serine/threonine-protein kinase PBL7 [Magnolia sinica]